MIGPGGLGAALREIQRVERVELSSVLAFSGAKNGEDAGSLAGIDSLSVAATTDSEQFHPSVARRRAGRSHLAGTGITSGFFNERWQC